MNKKPITKDTIKKVISQYKRYKLTLGEDYVIESISTEIADELRRNFTIEPIKTWAKSKKKKQDASNN
tara:strand:- start:137 stop:340 length:204 start_codon:yes stop_codon:yes gene_type:complete